MRNELKNIFIICSSLNLGGAEVQSVWLANQFAKKGYKVSYVVLKNTTFIESYLSKDRTNPIQNVCKRFKEKSS